MLPLPRYTILAPSAIPAGFMDGMKPPPPISPITRLSPRYTILAPSAIPAGFMDGMKATEKLVEALQLEENSFRMGHSKVSSGT